MIQKLVLFFLLLFTNGLRAQQTDTSQLSLLFVGDIMGHNTQIVSAYCDASKTYDYSECFKYIKPEISKADIAFANLEVMLAGKLCKGYPQFSSPDELAVAIKNVGFLVYPFIQLFFSICNISCGTR